MSYQDLARSGRELRSYANAEAGPEKGTKELIASIFKLQTEVTRLKNDVQKLGSGRDTVELRQKVGAAIQRIQSNAQAIKDKLMKLHNDSKTPQTTKIVNDFEATLKDFQNTMKIARSKEAATLPRRPEPPAAATSSSSKPPLDIESQGDPLEQAALLQEQQRQEVLSLDNYVTYNEALIEERDQGIAEIGQQINEVHEIFQDLAVLVHDQGEMVDDIDQNITRTAQHTEEANTQLQSAERHQRASRRRMCFILAVVGFILAVLVVVLSIR